MWYLHRPFQLIFLACAGLQISVKNLSSAKPKWKNYSKKLSMDVDNFAIM